MKTVRTIADHWDPAGVITAERDPSAEFALWREHAEQSPDWRGDEFSLTDFEDYIHNERKHQ